MLDVFNREIMIPLQNKLYYMFHKPYGVISQFTPDQPGQDCLKNWLDVPTDVYPIGRLDLDSEGLLLLTNDHRMNAAILNPKAVILKTYWAQVEGLIAMEEAKKLMDGVMIRSGKKPHLVRAQALQILTDAPSVFPRNPPIRERKNIPTSWISISITEGKNRQVRKMFAAIGFPVLRLIRYRIGTLNLDTLSPGEYRLLSSKDVNRVFQSNE